MAEIEMGDRRSARLSDQGVVGGEDDEDRMTFLDRVQEKLVQTLPQLGSIDHEDLSRLRVSFKLAFSNLLLYGALLAYFVINGTVTQQSRKFLSLDAPSAADATCHSVPVAVTGTYQADMQGVWSSQAAYDPKTPIYELQLTGSTVDLPGYSAAMMDFSRQLQAVGARSQGLDVLSSQALWTLFRAAHNAEAHMQLRAFADVQQTFMSLKAPPAPVLASRKGVCNGPVISAAYGYTNMVLTAAFPTSAMPSAAPIQQPTKLNSPTLPPSPTSFPAAATATDDGGFSFEPCPDQVVLNRGQVEGLNRVFGVADSASSSFDLDLRSVVTAYALNFGLIDASALSVYRERPHAASGDYSVTFVSPSYPDMQPVECHFFSKQPRVCLALAGSAATGTFSYVYPVLSTSTWAGTFEASPGRLCRCPQDQDDYFCNTGQYGQLSLVFSAAGSSSDTIAMAWGLQSKMEAEAGGAAEVRALVAGLGSTSVFVRNKISPTSYQDWMQGRTVYDETASPRKAVPLPRYQQFKNDFDQLGKGMSLMVFALERLWGAKVNLNAQGVELVNFATGSVNASSSASGNAPAAKVMCQDTLYQPAALAAMAATPPVSVVQPYLSCSSTLRSAFVTAAGIAAGNASLLSTIFITLTVFLIVAHNNTRCGRKKKADWFKVVAPGRKAARALAADRREKDALARENIRLAAQLSALQQALGAQAQHAQQMRDALTALGLAGLPPAPPIAAHHHAAPPGPLAHLLSLSHPHPTPSERLSAHALPHSQAHALTHGHPVTDLVGDNPMHTHHRNSGRTHAQG